MLILMLGGCANLSFASIYSWVDENGKVHYTDQKHKVEANNTEVEVVKVRDKYNVPQVDALEPIGYSGVEPNRTVALSSMILGLDGSDSREVLIGRVTCGKAIDLYWQEGQVDLASPATAQPVVEVFRKNGYAAENTIGGSVNPVQLALTAEITALKINSCPVRFNSSISQVASYVRINWKVSDPLSGKVVYQGETKGGHNGSRKPAIRDGISLSIQESFRSAARNLLADEVFVASLKPLAENQIKPAYEDEYTIALNYGLGRSSFRVRADSLKKNSVVIKTEAGHGSGVVVNGEGFVLTNAHVVGDAANVDVLVGSNTFHGVVIRRDEVRDVALIRAEKIRHLLKGVHLAAEMPVIGDEIFVIGTPLSMQNSQTITKGVVSAFREIDRVSFIQTDAAINLGNSGGPVFNEQGELIALTVAGMFTREGANLSINYLIPIEDALKRLSITNVTYKNSIVEAISRKAGVDVSDPAGKKTGESIDNTDSNKSEHWYLAVYNWLNAPIF